MTWTWDPTLLTGSTTTASLMKVRSMVGDTDTSWQLITDEEIYFCISATSANTYAAAAACDLIAASFARLVNTENSQLRVSAAARYTHYRDLADSLRAGGPGDVPGGDGSGVIRATPYVGGSSVSEKDSLRDNSDLVAPPFALGSDDFPTNSFDASRPAFGGDGDEDL